VHCRIGIRVEKTAIFVLQATKVHPNKDIGDEADAPPSETLALPNHQRAFRYAELGMLAQKTKYCPGHKNRSLQNWISITCDRLAPLSRLRQTS